ncbi:MAG: flagellar biosynthetic protein FliQ [Planctomycetota bacterium]
MYDPYQQAIDVINDMLEVTMTLSIPLLMSALIVGLIVSIFQTATSIQEQTLAFVPKILAVGALVIFLFPWMSRTLIEYTERLWIDVMPVFLVGRTGGA